MTGYKAVVPLGMFVGFELGRFFDEAFDAQAAPRAHYRQLVEHFDRFDVAQQQQQQQQQQQRSGLPLG